jgi:putative pyrroloquinoline-quinone-binding quinoprotein
LPAGKANWIGYKGGARRTGVNEASFESGIVTSPTRLRLRLGDTCRSLLGYDGHVVAVSVNGVVEIADPIGARVVCRFQTQGPVNAEPCIHDGVLYVATHGQLSAYALASMTAGTPRVRPLWQVALNGTPIQALTPAGDRLYVTVASAGRREIQLVTQQRAHFVYAAQKLSWIAADDAAAPRALFFSEDDGHVQLHVVRDQLTSIPVPLQSIGDHPIALLGDTVFAVFGDARRLYRIDTNSGSIQEPLDEDTQMFALTHDGAEWDREYVRVDSGGIHFSRDMVRDSFAPHERAWRGSPVVVQDCAVIVGMEDGRVFIYDIAQLPQHDIWRLEGNGNAPITALASFDAFIAAGNRDGAVEIRELVAKTKTR